MTPYVKKLEKFTTEAKEVLLEQQDKRSSFADQKRTPAPSYSSGDLVLVTKPNQSNKNADFTSKFMPHPLTPFQGNVIPPVKALRRRGRPARIIKPSSPTPANAQIHKGSQNTSSADPWSGCLRGQVGRL
ncbi:hypothetical protein NPIL_540011 [Nephila pilipes]|uniref:Uncharacterized protein n=1 Tax=Nephila pilipes TaxID=299642 RepID=A0A8X6U8S8_NEPPI|nr:hypothetical protein NPIL_540011 [Nephila pilipes]